MNDTTCTPVILLLEPLFVLRRTIVAVTHQLGVARIEDAPSKDAAMALLASTRFDAIVFDLDLDAAALDLLARLRQGLFASDAGTPVIGTTSETGPAVEVRVQPYAVQELIRKPFKVGELLQLIQRMIRR